MKAKDVMTHCVVSVAPDAPILQAIARMISHQVSGMPVIDADGRLIGMVTEGDFLRRAETRTEAPRRRWLGLLHEAGSRADGYVRAHGRTVQDVMSPNVITVGDQTPLKEVVDLMEERGVKRIPVVDGDRVVGIVSRADLMFALSEYLTKSKKAPTSDASLLRRIVSEMRKQTWCPLHSLKVTVREGVVILSGTIFDERARRALRVLVENVEGVKRVREHLKLSEPMSGTAIDVPKGIEVAKRVGETSLRSSGAKLDRALTIPRLRDRAGGAPNTLATRHRSREASACAAQVVRNGK
jgi:CBS domain-containing protein